MSKRFTLYLGPAGSGKSTALAQTFADMVRKNKCVMLAPTHYAVNNIMQKVLKLNKNIDTKLFQTFHSYFRIDYKSNLVIGPNTSSKDKEFIFIDEFFMLSRDLFARSVRTTNAKFILAGDPMQLGSPYNDSNVLLSGSELKSLEYWTDRESQVPSLPCSWIVIKMVQSPYWSIKDSVEKHIFRTNFRARDDVALLLFALLGGGAFDETVGKLIKYHTSYDDIIRYLINNDDAVLLASKYSILQNIYDNYAAKSSIFTTHIHNKQTSKFFEGNKYFRDLYLYEGMSLIITETAGDIYNGQEVIFEGYDEGTNTITCKDLSAKTITLHINNPDQEFFAIAPKQFMTIHKAQGMGFNKVVIMTNNLFEKSMLYTAITRARYEVSFYLGEGPYDYAAAKEPSDYKKNIWNTLLQLFNADLLLEYAKKFEYIS